MNGIILIDKIFLIVALLFSLFYGFFCKQIWFPENKNITKSRWLHEVWFNFVGSLIGWICIYAIYKSLSIFTWQTLVSNILWQHIILFLVGVLGIIGLLPYVLWGISRAVDQLISKILGRT